MEVIIQLIVGILMMFWCYKVAEKNGRNVVLALFLSFFFGIFAVIGYYIAGKKEQQNG